MIKGMLYVCPDCKRLVLYYPDADGTILNNSIMCANDGYQMRLFIIDNLFLDRMLQGKDLNNSED